MLTEALNYKASKYKTLNYFIGVLNMNFKSKSSRNGSTRGRSVKYPNVYDVIAKVEAGKPTNWIENAILAGFTPDEIEAMIETNLE